MKVYEAYEGDTFIATGTIKDIAAALGVSESRARAMANRGHSKYTVIEIGTRRQIYAYYFNDEFVTEGTMHQIAEVTGEQLVTLNFLSSNAAKKRNLTKTLIKLEGETMIVKRTHGAKFAPVPTNDERKEAIKVFKNVPVKPAEWKPSDYTRDLFEHTFRKWA
ncbi:hypothetical protein [Jeotgalicoccus psychrophilus]|uniref:hypothetical protein n=1 Tax=Jeotgalicoccus psychrophilus TaxID=157228 RepID=UPI0004123925|nr:hypothetical protein [Jeotgalicoccus psychrophilus]